MVSCMHVVLRRGRAADSPGILRTYYMVTILTQRVSCVVLVGAADFVRWRPETLQ